MPCNAACPQGGLWLLSPSYTMGNRGPAPPNLHDLGSSFSVYIVFPGIWDVCKLEFELGCCVKEAAGWISLVEKLSGWVYDLVLTTTAGKKKKIAAMLTIIDSFKSRPSRDLNYVIFSKFPIPFPKNLSGSVQWVYLFNIMVLTCMWFLFLIIHIH